MIYSVPHLSEVITVISDTPLLSISNEVLSSAVIVGWYSEIILDKEESVDLIELTEAFLAAKQHAFSPNTRRAYRYDLTAHAMRNEVVAELMTE